MTSLQRKAIAEAIRILETIEARALFPENYRTPDDLKAAAKKHQDAVFADAGAKIRAVEWLKSALE